MMSRLPIHPASPWSLLIQLTAMMITVGCGSTVISSVEPDQDPGVQAHSVLNQTPIRLLYEAGTEEQINGIDIGIAFALAQGVPEDQIANYVNSILDVGTIDDPETQIGSDPIDRSDFDGNGINAEIFDAAIVFGLDELNLIGAPNNEATITSLETLINTDLSLSPDGTYEISDPNAVPTLVQPELPVIEIEATDANASEETQDPGQFTIRLDAAATADLDVAYTVGGTATDPDDFDAEPDLIGTITIPAGETEVTITITPVDDAEPEADETIELTLTESPTYTLGDSTTATVTLIDDGDPILFTDPNLEAVVREAIEIPTDPILLADVQSLTILNGIDAGITSLDGIEALTNLNQLFLNTNTIADLSPLANLTNLTQLQLANNQISDLSPLANLINLTELQLASNPITDLTPLTSLINLNDLNLAANQIADIQSLVDNLGLDSGDIVDLRNNPLSFNSINTLIPNLQDREVNVLFTESITFADPNLEAAVREELGIPTEIIRPQDVIGLRFLNASNLMIESLEGIEGLVNLQELHLNDNMISDPSPLSELANLRDLFLRNNQISDPSSLALLTQLRDLALNNNGITDASSLASLTNLNRLLIRENAIFDLTFLENLINLEVLDLSTNLIETIDPLANLINLTDLDLSSNQITNIQALVDNAGIDTDDAVVLTNNNLDDVSINVLIPELQSRSVLVFF